ncbi:MFS transporter [Rathayibacter sp. Leaf299]|uniref:MFS transporter n=1 Tax=Rathayibacter sp. Leaf299 TaxID=1736328 RepID=UPI000701AF4E|nr:MFS transporter [Rathayibacter sp. Leaf299]KQQ19321.1 MFS transporter [Rathayibacter sp. Leaf299]
MAPALPRALRPFETRGYRFLAGSLALSLLASGVWIVALVWQVIALGGGPGDVSLVATASALGLVLAVLLGGVLADRVPQRRILIVVEAVRVLVVLAAVALSSAGILTVWQLTAVAFVLGVGEAFFFPAYSALLPRLLPADQLLAANGVEGALRPIAQSAAGPAIAGAVIAVSAPSAAFAVAAVGYALALAGLLLVGPVPFERAADAGGSALGSAVRDLREGFGYMVRTRWLLATLLFAIVLVFLVVGPIEVLVPFAVRDQTGTGASGYALALTAYGVGGVVGSLVVSSRPVPRRYLTTMILLWGFGALPFVLLGVVDQLWMIAAILFLDGVTGAAAQVLWGTLLQQRVPSALLGRVSSLDFFVSLALMPVSMAVAGPVGEAVGIAPTFAVVGVLAAVSAVVTLLLARLGPDELAHPLRDG